MQTLAQDPEADKKAAAEPLSAEAAAAAAAAPSAATSAAPGGGLDTVSGLLGSPEGAALRRVAMDADSMSLIWHLVRAGHHSSRVPSVPFQPDRLQPRREGCCAGSGSRRRLSAFSLPCYPR